MISTECQRSTATVTILVISSNGQQVLYILKTNVVLYILIFVIFWCYLVGFFFLAKGML